MPFSRPTLETLVSRTKADLETRLGASGSTLRRSVVAVLARVVAGVAHLLYGYLDWIFRQVFADTAEASELERHASIWGITRKAATFAQFQVTFTGTNGTVIPSGTLLARSDEIEFETIASATISAGAATVEAICTSAGVTGNTDLGTLLNLVSPIAGVNSSATVGAASENAEDAEADDDLLSRLLDRIQNPPHGGNENDYKQWALEVAGVTRAWCYPSQFGDGTVGIAFVMDDKTPSIIPEPADITAVQSHIDSVRPVTADVTVYAPTAVPVNFTIDPTPASADVKAAIEAELEDLIRRECEPGGTLLLSRIREAISTAAGEIDHSLTVPSANVTFASGEIGVMGTVTWL